MSVRLKVGSFFSLYRLTLAERVLRQSVHPEILSWPSGKVPMWACFLIWCLDQWWVDLVLGFMEAGLDPGFTEVGL